MRPLWLALMLVALHAGWAAIVAAQEPPDDSVPGGTSDEKPPIGAHTPYENSRGGSIVGGRPGSLRPRAPIITRPPGPGRVAPGLPVPQQPPAPRRQVAVPNSWSVLFEIEDEGPANGLTLDAAIERLVHASLSLRAKSLDIPQAQADVLTAGMRANPLLYFDGQLIPYKQYNAVTNPGGPTQYDLNLAYPVDLSGKRQARVEVARAAKRVAEATYKDAVRQEIDRLYSAYVDALSARLAARTIQSGLTRIDEIQNRAGQEKKAPREAEALRHQVQIQRHTLVVASIDAEAAWKSSKRVLATMLNLSSEQARSLDLRGTIEDKAPPPVPLQELVESALVNRPDLAAYRLGLKRAGADVQLSKANALPDVYVLYQPFTYQDNRPFHQPSSQSWAAGATVTVPLFDRNQGNIQRASVNVNQSQVELQALEQRVVSEVESAYDEYVATRRGLDEIEGALLPEAEKESGLNLQHFREGTLDAASYLNAHQSLDYLGRQYRDLLVRHRRSMLTINSAVGTRVFP